MAVIAFVTAFSLFAFVTLVSSAPVQVQVSSSFGCTKVALPLKQFRRAGDGKTAPQRKDVRCTSTCRLGERRQLCSGPYDFRSGLLLTEKLCSLRPTVCNASQLSCPVESVLHPRETGTCAPSLSTSKCQPCTVEQNDNRRQFLCTRESERQEARDMSGCSHITLTNETINGTSTQVQTVYDFVHGQEVKFLRALKKKNRVTGRVCTCVDGKWIKAKALEGKASKTNSQCKLSNARPIGARMTLCHSVWNDVHRSGLNVQRQTARQAEQ